MCNQHGAWYFSAKKRGVHVAKTKVQKDTKTNARTHTPTNAKNQQSQQSHLYGFMNVCMYACM